MTDEERQNICLSVFGNQPPATMEQITLQCKQLALCFPQMPSTFWGFVCKEAVARGISAQRMDYICHQLVSNHRFPTVTIADIFAIDKEIHTISFDVFNGLVYPHPPICQIELAGKKRVVYVHDAKECGYRYERCFSPSEQNCIRYNKSYYLETQKTLYDTDYHNANHPVRTDNAGGVVQ